MRILVVGVGKLGMMVAENLSREDHDVVIVDTNESVIERCEDTLDVLCVKGNGANAAVLMEAGVDKADIIICTTASDETNMLCSLIAKRLGAQYAIARVRDPEYNESLTLMQRELGIDMALNPERATALEISRLLRFPFASTIETFAKGRVEMVAFKALEDDAIVNRPLKDLTQHRHLHSLPRVLYSVIERGDQVFIPNGDFIIRAGDRVHVAADMVTITKYFNALGKGNVRIKNVMLLGGGRISYYLAKMIAPVGMRVSMIEIDRDKAQFLGELLPDVSVIHGDGTDQDLLEQEGLRDMDAFVTLCNRDEENLLTGLHAVRKGVPKVIVKNNRIAYTEITNDLGLDTIVSPKSITCSAILRYARARVNGEGTKVEKLYRLVDERVEAMEFIARAEDPYINKPLKDLRIRPSTLVAVIVRHGKVIVPFGNDHIEAGDTVVIIACESGISDLNEVIRV